MRKFSIIIFILLLQLSCKKKVDDPVPAENIPVSNVPSIKLEKVIPMAVKEFKDSIVFTIFYQDGNGDLGFENADSMAISLTDSRAELVREYHIPPLAPSGTGIAIQGRLNVVLDHTNLLDQNSTSETAVYKIKIRDRTGQWSNTVSTEAVTISK